MTRLRLIEVARTLVSRLDLEGVLQIVLEAGRELTGASFAALNIPGENDDEPDRLVTLGIDGEPWAETGQIPSGHDAVAVPILILGETWGNLHLIGKEDGVGFDESDEAALAVLADWAAIAVQNARLHEGLARRHNEVERQRDQAEHSAQALAVMTDIALSVGGETDTGHILGLIVDRGRTLVQASALLIMLADGEELVVAATAGSLDTNLHGRRIPAKSTLAGSVLSSLRAIRLGRADSEAELGTLGVTAEAAMLVPLTFRGISSGVLIALDRLADGPDFGLEDERLLRSFAASAGTAVATAKSVEAERLRQSLEAAEQERKRWARELHDETLQALGGLRMLHSAALRTDAGGTEMREALSDGIDLIDAEIDNLSALIAELRPAALDEIGLVPALRTLAERKSREGGISVDVLSRFDEDARLPPETESMLYRFAQEALTNVVKHAGASRVEVMLERTGDVVEISVHDDGHGFDTSAVTDGFGLIGMRERVKLADGELRISATAGRGTTVSAIIPTQTGSATT